MKPLYFVIFRNDGIPSGMDTEWFDTEEEAVNFARDQGVPWIMIQGIELDRGLQ